MISSDPQPVGVREFGGVGEWRGVAAGDARFDLQRQRAVRPSRQREADLFRPGGMLGAGEHGDEAHVGDRLGLDRVWRPCGAEELVAGEVEHLDERLEGGEQRRGVLFKHVRPRSRLGGEDHRVAGAPQDPRMEEQ